MRFRLRTLLIVLALGPMVVAILGAAIVAEWSARSSTPTATDPAVRRLIDQAKNAPPWDENSFEATLTQGQEHEYSLMSDERQREYRRQKGF